MNFPLRATHKPKLFFLAVDSFLFFFFFFFFLFLHHLSAILFPLPRNVLSTSKREGLTLNELNTLSVNDYQYNHCFYCLYIDISQLSACCTWGKKMCKFSRHRDKTWGGMTSLFPFTFQTVTVPDKSQLSLCAHVLLLLPPVFQLWPHSDSDSELCFTLCNYSSDESRRIKVVFVVARQKLMMLLERIIRSQQWCVFLSMSKIVFLPL